MRRPPIVKEKTQGRPQRPRAFLIIHKCVLVGFDVLVDNFLQRSVFLELAERLVYLFQQLVAMDSTALLISGTIACAEFA